MERRQPEPSEVALGRGVLALLQRLDQEMDDIHQELLETRRPIERQRGRVAQGIAILCRNLADEIQRYEHLCWLQEEDLDADLTEDDLDF